MATTRDWAKLSNPKSNLVAHVTDFALKLSRSFDAIFQ
jgi:hypothetical protein